MSTMSDQKRMTFMLERDGPLAALEFAQQCRFVYRGAVLKMKQQHGKQGAYRKAYIESYLFHKKWLWACADKIEEHS